MRYVPILLAVLVLAGCKSSLFESLDEAQANQIVAVLSEHGIHGYKERNDDKTWNVFVDRGSLVAATEVTREYALPRGSHTNLGELFSRQGLISNPEEDQVRYVYGLAQELAETLEKIDGVLIARVHIVQPERDPLMRPVTAPSASVMMRYRSDYNLDYMKDKIRGLVAGSVEGLAADQVNLTLIPVTPMADARRRCSDGIACEGAAWPPLRWVLGGLAGLSMALIFGTWAWDKGFRSLVPVFLRRRRSGNVMRPPVPPAGKDAP